MRKILMIALLSVLGGCASPSLPTSGTPTVYDGKWNGNLSSQLSKCQRVTVNLDVRFGQFVGNVYNNGSRVADVWGEILPNGKLSGKIGKLGISRGEADIQFKENTANGTWKSGSCFGIASLKRVS